MYFRETKTLEFQQVADRLMRLLGEEALCRLPTVVEGQVDTPCGICTGEKKRKTHVVLLSILSPYI
jgi:uracil phosphoribosyltransferase